MTPASYKTHLPGRLGSLICLLLSLASFPFASERQAAKPLLVAHRGASGYAPEHTLAAYRLAVDLGADFVEQDLHLTRDGALVCLHDADLARTTNVEDLFPDRSTVRDAKGEGKPARGWYAIDFTLAEIKRLDAGSWFNKANPFAARDAFVGERVPTLQEAIASIADRAGLYIELKDYAFYKSLGFDMAEKLAAALDASGYAKRSNRIMVQCFYKEGLLRMRKVAPLYTRVQLLPMSDKGRNDTDRITRGLAAEIASYARGVGPSKDMLKGAADVALLHRAGLVVHPYTFRGSTTASLRKPLDAPLADGSTLRREVTTDMERFLSYGIDGGFTDYPDLWREAVLTSRR